jgi:hypothetical protein
MQQRKRKITVVPQDSFSSVLHLIQGYGFEKKNVSSRAKSLLPEELPRKASIEVPVPVISLYSYFFTT